MSQIVYLVCGVPGSGKTWVCEQLKDKFHYIPHDRYYTMHANQIRKEAVDALKPIITESPFGERQLREELERAGLTVIPYFVIEEGKVAKTRYEAREKKLYPKHFFTRAGTIRKRAFEWDAPAGTSKEILELLKSVIL